MTKKISIAIVGFFNVENAGDERLRQVWIRMLPTVDLTFFNMSQISRNSLAPFDWIILGGGSIIHGHNPLITHSEKLLSPHHRFGAAGVSVSGNYDAALTPAVQSVIRRSDFFYVRDEKSAKMIGGNVTVGPDLSWLHPIPAYDLEAANDVTMILAPCDWKPEYNPRLWVSEFRPLSTAQAPMFFGRDDNLLRDLGVGAPTEFSRVQIWRSKVVVSMRLHGIMFALQAGKPVIAIDYDDKVRTFMDENRLGSYCFAVDEPGEAVRKTVSILSEIDRHKLAFQNASDLLEDKGKLVRHSITGAIMASAGDNSRKRSLWRKGVDKLKEKM